MMRTSTNTDILLVLLQKLHHTCIPPARSPRSRQYRTQDRIVGRRYQELPAWSGNLWKRSTRLGEGGCADFRGYAPIVDIYLIIWECEQDHQYHNLGASITDACANVQAPTKVRCVCRETCHSTLRIWRSYILFQHTSPAAVGNSSRSGWGTHNPPGCCPDTIDGIVPHPTISPLAGSPSQHHPSTIACSPCR